MSARSKPNREGEAPAEPERDGAALPEGWARTSLGELASLVSGAGFPIDQQNQSGHQLPFFKVGNLGEVESGLPLLNSNHSVSAETARNLGAKIIPKDAIVFAKIGMAIALNRRRLLGQPSCIDNNMMAAIPGAAVETKYLLRYVETVDLMPLAQATTVPSLRKGDLESIAVPLPPLAEQRRIVGKLELVLGKVSSSQQRLSRVPGLLKRFRQSVLAAACSGKLTADWREENKDQIPEQPLSTTVDNFRRACWERDQLERMKAKGTPPKNDKWKAAYESQSFEPMDESPEIPEGWDWIRLGLLGHDPLSTVQTGPFGAQLHNDEFTPEGVPVIAVGNLTGMGFKQDGLYFITPQKAEQLCRYDVQAGDVLFARSGATLGKVCVAPNYVRDWRMTGHILRVRLNTDFILPEIVVFALHGDPSVRYQVSGNVRGITRPGFNTSLLESISVPVAPLSEQQEIVRRVEKLFALADQIESRLRQAQAHVDRLTQSLLAKAFRGELVPTEHTLAEQQHRDYEPASALLARIQAERKSTTEQSPKNGKRHSVQK